MNDIDILFSLLKFDSTLKDALEVIENGQERLCFIVDNNLVLKQVISDGDIRRALLKGFTLDDKIDSIHERSPVIVREGCDIIQASDKISEKIYNHINENKEVIFFTYPTIDNYLNHFWYDIWEENEGFLQGFPEGDVYSWYKGNIFDKDMKRKILRLDHKICLFNNSTADDGDVNEIKELW